MKVIASCVLGLSLIGCDQTSGVSQPASSEPVIAARVSMPSNLGTLSPLDLHAYPTITYYLDGYYSSVATWNASAVEAFKEWTAAITDKDHRARFVQTFDPELAHIKVMYGSGSTVRGGCVETNGVRFCDLIVPGPTKIHLAIAAALGVPNSQTTGDVLNGTSPNLLFTQSDLNLISYTFGGIYNGTVTPIFDVAYYNASGNETILGWATLRSRMIPGPYYVKSGIADRKIVGLAMTNSNAGYWDWPATFGIQTYVIGSAYGNSRLASWPHMTSTYAYLDPNWALSGNDPAPGVLGYPGCPDITVSPTNQDPQLVPQLFSFEPSQTFIGGYPYLSKQPARYLPGQTTQLFFYKEPALGRYRVSTTYPTGNVACVRLGGYALSVN